MFRCKKCKKIDRIGLMISPAYQGKGEYLQRFNDKGDIVITVDGYEFIPDLLFMNAHAVCKYCGEIKIWEYFDS